MERNRARRTVSARLLRRAGPSIVRDLPAVRRGLLHGVLLFAILGAGLMAARWRLRPFPSAWPEAGGFSEPLAELCAHPDAPGRNWRYIVIHHSATTGGGAAAFHRYHVRVRGWESLGYHFVIGNGSQTGDGEIEVASRWQRQQAGSHVAAHEFNERGIGICLVGHFGHQHPTEQQMRSLDALVRYLMARYGIAADDVLGHGECPGAETECPGRNFPIREFRDSLRRDAAAGGAVAGPLPLR